MAYQDQKDMNKAQVLPPPILRPTARPTEPGKRQKLWDRGFEIEQMRAEYEAGKSLETIIKVWECDARFARACIVLAGGKIKSYVPKSKRKLETTKRNISETDRKRRSENMRANQAKGVLTRKKRIEAFADDKNSDDSIAVNLGMTLQELAELEKPEVGTTRKFACCGGALL